VRIQEFDFSSSPKNQSTPLKIKQGTAAAKVTTKSEVSHGYQTQDPAIGYATSESKMPLVCLPVPPQSERNLMMNSTLPTAELILEFKVDGMTCVACSRTIENAISSEFGAKGLISV
jgi:hypothetical protein